jgi:hypothetical protein
VGALHPGIKLRFQMLLLLGQRKVNGAQQQLAEGA